MVIAVGAGHAPLLFLPVNWLYPHYYDGKTTNPLNLPKPQANFSAMPHLHFETLGHGKPIVMLHGWAMHGGIWRDFAVHLAETYQVTLVDLPGHGLSSALAAFTLDALVDCLAEALPDTPCCWLGWSLGATITLAMAARYPQRVKQMILLTGNPCFLEQDGWPGMQASVLEGFAASLRQDVQTTLVNFLAIQVMNLPNARDLTKALKAAMLARPAPDIEALRGGLEILKTTDLRPTLAGINVPTLAVWGQRDRLIPASLSTYLPALMPLARVQVLAQAAHVPFLTHPQELLELIGDFLEGR